VEFTSDGGTMLFRGTNYTIEGQFEHSFSCRLLYHDWPHSLVFRYDEASDNRPLRHGQTTVTFSDWRRGKPQYFQITIDDKANKQQVSASGCRIVEKEYLKQLKASVRSPETLRAIYNHYAPFFAPEA
jgi:uncharacterized protein YndB with AHSA1/START domain